MNWLWRNNLWKKIIDCKGLNCPLPVVNAKKAADELATGDVLTVLVDNGIAVQNLLRFASGKGFSAASEKKDGAEFAVTMQITASQAVPAEDEEEEISCAMDARKKGMLVVLSANAMGGGEEKLGKSLMKAFVFALTKQDQLPWTFWWTIPVPWKM